MRTVSEKVRTRIIEAAKTILAERGVTNTTLRAIAAEAGISNGALYYYYNSKAQILYEIMDQASSESTKLAAQISQKELDHAELEQRVRQMIVKQISEADENKLLFYLATEAIMGNLDLKRKFTEKYRSWVDGIEDVLVGYYAVPKSSMSRAIAMILNAAIDGFALQRLLGVNVQEDIQAIIRLGNLLIKNDLKTVLEEFGGKTSTR